MYRSLCLAGTVAPSSKSSAPVQTLLQQAKPLTLGGSAVCFDPFRTIDCGQTQCEEVRRRVAMRAHDYCKGKGCSWADLTHFCLRSGGQGCKGYLGWDRSLWGIEEKRQSVPCEGHAPAVRAGRSHDAPGGTTAKGVDCVRPQCRRAPRGARSPSGKAGPVLRPRRWKICPLWGSGAISVPDKVPRCPRRWVSHRVAKKCGAPPKRNYLLNQCTHSPRR